MVESPSPSNLNTLSPTKQVEGGFDKEMWKEVMREVVQSAKFFNNEHSRQKWYEAEHDLRQGLAEDEQEKMRLEDLTAQERDGGEEERLRIRGTGS